MDVADGVDWVTTVNPDSLEKMGAAIAEPCLAKAEPGERFQFERIGYFCCDTDSKPDTLVFNRTVSLRDTWAKIEKKGG
jgi:glutaminyl-tRNA synthetase